MRRHGNWAGSAGSGWVDLGLVKQGIVAVKLDEIRKAADRVAASLGLDVVDVEFTGTAKSRTLCIYLEKNAEGRAAQAAIAAAAVADPEAAANVRKPNVRKHGIRFEAASLVFFDPCV